MIDELVLVIMLVTFEIVMKIFVGITVEEIFTQTNLEEVGNYENEI